MNEKLSLACMRRLKRERDEARKWSAAWKYAAKSRKRFNTTAVEPLIEALSKDAELRAELAEVAKDRDYWADRARWLEAKRVEGLQPPYKFGGEGVA